MSSFRFDNRQMTEIILNVFYSTYHFREFHTKSEALIEYSEMKKNINRIDFYSAICE